MLADASAIATIAVKDLSKARQFYEGTLGLKPAGSEVSEEVVRYKTGRSELLVYRSEYAGTNKATAVTWFVGNEVEKVVQALKAKGVTFEHYDFPGVVHKGDVHVMGAMQVAWFKDPDGNIQSIVNG